MIPILLDEAKESAIKSYVEEMKVKATLVIHDTNSLEIGINFCTGVKKAIKKLEANRTELVKPLNDHVKMINDKFKFYTEPLKEMEEAIKARMVKYQKALMTAQANAENEARDKRQAELNKILKEEHERKEVLKAEMEAKKAPQATIDKALEESQKAYELKADAIITSPEIIKPVENTVRAGAGKMVTRKTWNYKIIDQALVPEKYKVIAGASVRYDLAQGVREIPGLEIFEEINVAI